MCMTGNANHVSQRLLDVLHECLTPREFKNILKSFLMITQHLVTYNLKTESLSNVSKL